MAIQSEVFSTAFNVRTFASTKYIATKQHMAIWLKRVSDETWTQLSVNEFELINNSAVLIDAPSSSIYSMIEIRVADEPNELGSSQSDITIVASLESQIQELVDTVIPNINEILLADDNATTATTKASEASTSASEALASKNSAVISAGNALASEQNADTSEANALIYKNSAETSATTATTQTGIATTKAGEASTSASNALGYRNEAEAFRDEAEASALSVDSANIVHKTGDETIAGVKTFSGNVGIGVTPSAWGSATKAVDIKNGSFYSTSDSDIQVAQNTYFNSSGNWIYKTSGYASAYYQLDGTHSWRTAPSGTAGNPITWTNAMSLDNSGRLLLNSGTGGLGYGTGSGGTVTQLTSKSTAVTLNKPTGRIITHNASLAAGASVALQVNNSLFSFFDTVVLAGKSYSGRYRIESSNSSTGSFGIRITNIDGIAYTDVIEIDFAVIKGSTN